MRFWGKIRFYYYYELRVYPEIMPEIPFWFWSNSDSGSGSVSWKLGRSRSEKDWNDLSLPLPRVAADCARVVVRSARRLGLWLAEAEPLAARYGGMAEARPPLVGQRGAGGASRRGASSSKAGPPLPLGLGEMTWGPHDREKKVPTQKSGYYIYIIINVRLHQIGIKGRIWTYPARKAKGYNFVIVSFKLCICIWIKIKKKKLPCEILLR